MRVCFNSTLFEPEHKERAREDVLFFFWFVCSQHLITPLFPVSILAMEIGLSSVAFGMAYTV